MKQQVIRIVKISGIFIGGVIIGGVLMNLLHMYVRPTYREGIRIDLKTEQEFLSARAARRGDNLRAISHRWNVVDAEAKDGFRAFRKERNRDMDSSFFFPLAMLMLKVIQIPMGDRDKADRLRESMDRGKLAIALETVGEKEEAAKQWEMARLLIRQMSVEDIRRCVLGEMEIEKIDVHLRAEKAILGETNEAQDNQPDRE